MAWSMVHEVTPHNGNGHSNGARIRTDVEVAGTYLLSPVDDSNERWSRPEWVVWGVTRACCLGILIGGIWVLGSQQLNREVQLIAASLVPAAGFKLIDGLSNASNKRHTSQGINTGSN